MPTKRPDQLPEGSDFNLDDILLIEKSPDSNAKQLLKSTIREFMSSATQFDPQNVGAVTILGFQSKFEWVVAQMEKLQSNPTANITPYAEFESEAKNQEVAATTPSVTPTLTPTPTPSLTPFLTPTPSITPSASSFPKETQWIITGRSTTTVSLPLDLLPIRRGYSSWKIKAGTFTGDESGLLSANFNGFFPDSFESSQFDERLSMLFKVEGQDSVKVDTVLLETFDLGGEIFINENSQLGLLENSQLIITIEYS
jgi:hypothetical protein